MSFTCPGGIEIGLLGLCGDGAAHVVRVDDGDLDGMVAVRSGVLAWLDVGAYLEVWGDSAEVRLDDLHEVVGTLDTPAARHERVERGEPVPARCAGAQTVEHYVIRGVTQQDGHDLSVLFVGQRAVQQSGGRLSDEPEPGDDDVG